MTLCLQISMLSVRAELQRFVIAYRECKTQYACERKRESEKNNSLMMYYTSCESSVRVLLLIDWKTFSSNGSSVFGKLADALQKNYCSLPP